jgi:hypothetical protein
LTEENGANGIFVVFFGIRMREYLSAFAHVAQLAEHVLGKDEVISSILIMGSRNLNKRSKKE